MRQGIELTEQSDNAEDPYELRLMALLQQMVRDKGRMRAARELGVDHRTVAASIEGSRLSKRVRGALEFALLTGADPEAARQRERLASLEKRVDNLEGMVKAGHTELSRVIEDEISGLRDDFSQSMLHFEKRLAALESAPRDQVVTEKPRVKPVRRQYPELVTMEPELGEEEVYGDATPVIVQWRKVRVEYETARTKLREATAQQRRLELEIEIIDKYELTLPPSTYPWDLSRRRSEVRSRERVLQDVRLKRVLAISRRWLRRVFTLGLWRN